MDDQVGGRALLVLGDHAERPDLGEAVAGAGLRLVRKIAAAAAVAHQQYAPRRVERHDRQLDPPAGHHHGARLQRCERVLALAEVKDVREVVLEALDLVGTGLQLQ
jgi:hypothetical protein